MPDENDGISRRSLFRVAAAATVTVVGLSKIASVAKAKALEKKGYVTSTEEEEEEETTEKETKKASRKKKGAKKKASRKKKAAKKKASS